MSLAILCALFSVVGALCLTGSPTIPESGMTTTPPDLRFAKDLRKRGTPENFCGFSENGTWSCIDTNLACRATILPKGDAYVFCSTSDVPASNQFFWTTGYDDWNTNANICPTHAICCYGEAARVVTNYFTSKGYTLTEYDCAVIVTTGYWKPATQLLYPSSFSVSLAEATASLSRSEGLLSTTTTTGSAQTSTTSSSSETNHSNSGLSQGAEAGIGAGVGGAVGLALIFGVFFCCWRRNKKSKEQVSEVQHSTVQYSPTKPYDQLQYYRQSASPPWSPQPELPSSAIPSNNDPTATGYLVEPNSREVYGQGSEREDR